MPWVIPVVLAASAVYSGVSAATKKAPNSAMEGYKPPDYYEDPNFNDTQTFLSKYGKDLLEGKPNDYYGEIGAYGSPEFEKILGLSNRDIEQSAAEAAARSGRGRGGYLPSMTAQTVADNSSKLRYADYLKAMQGRQFLMGEGKDITEGVRTAGFQNQSLRNQFNLSSSSLDMNSRKYWDEYDQMTRDWRKQQEGSVIGSIGSAVSSVAGLYGGGGGGGGGLVGSLSGGGSGGSGGLSAQSLNQLFGMFGGSGNNSDSLSSSTAGVSSLGKIQSSDDISNFLAMYSKNFRN